MEMSAVKLEGCRLRAVMRAVGVGEVVGLETIGVSPRDAFPDLADCAVHGGLHLQHSSREFLRGRPYLRAILIRGEKLGAVMLDLSEHHGLDDPTSSKKSISPLASTSNRVASNDLLQLFVRPRGQELGAQPDSQDPRVAFEELLPDRLWPTASLNQR
ncbi:unnamed protein product [Penicillium discolor]